MRKPIQFLFVTILTLGVCFTACDNGTTSGDTYSYAPLMVTGKNYMGKDVTVTFTTARKAAEEKQPLSELGTDDTYGITLDEKTLSEGTISVAGSFITFIPQSGKRFTGTYKNGMLNFAKGGGGGGGGGGRPSGGNPGAGGITPVTVTFMRNDGTEAEYDTRPATPGSPVTGGLPDEPTRTNYAFSGWKDGNGDSFDADTPITASITVYAQWKAKWVSVSAGNNHTLAIKGDGSLWAWGDNEYGQLGLGGITADQSSPVKVESPANTWASVSAGTNYSLAIDEERNLYAWGKGWAGELGLGEISECDTPTKVEFPDVKWKSVSAGKSHTLAIDTNGKLWAWGFNRAGQLGIGPVPTLVYIPTQVGTDTWLSVSAGIDYSAGVKTSGPLWVWGSCNKVPVQVGSDENWASVSAKTDYTMAVKEDGSLWAWGQNIYGKLGLGDANARTSPVEIKSPANTWLSVSAGAYHTLAIDTSKNLWAWGHNSSGQLGIGDSDGFDKYSPVRVESPATTWTSVSAGETHSMAIDMDGNLWAWGNNSSGQLGLGDDMPKQVKTPARLP